MQLACDWAYAVGVFMPDAPRLLLNGSPVDCAGASPATTLLDWLRGTAGLTGTKEGCAEGDCGACTVVLERATARGIERRAANACMLMLGQVDGLGVRTVEGLAADAARLDGLHPVQRAFVETGGTQCGFCTPGFIMAAYAFACETGACETGACETGACETGACETGSCGHEPPETHRIHDALAGNLCRCTGYRPIVQAMAQCAGSAPVDDAGLDAGLAGIARTDDASFTAGGCAFFAPRSLAAALALRAAHPAAQLLGGGTDLGLLASHRRTPPASLIHLGHVPDLTSLSEGAGWLRIGAALPYSDAMGALIARHPTLDAYLTRLGSRQIRNLGTIGGNLGTASPIGDSHPVLIALGAEIELASAARGARRVAADAFFTGYRTSALQPDEIITAIHIPDPPGDAALVAEKISKRRDQDISTVSAAFLVRVVAGRIEAVRLAYGGVAATPVRARAAEAALLGQAANAASFAAAQAALAQDIAPLGDWRGSAAYRNRVAGNLLRRLHLRLTHPDIALEVHAS